MAEPLELPEPDPSWLQPRPDAELAAFTIRSRRGDPCAERLRSDRQQRLPLAELAKLTAIQGDALMGIFTAVFDGLGLTPDQRERAKAIAFAEVTKVSVEQLP